MGMFDELEHQRLARESKAGAALAEQAQADAAAREQRQRAAGQAEATFARLEKMVTAVLADLRDAVYPECEVRADRLQLRWLLGIQPAHGNGQPDPFDPVIIVAPLFDSDGASTRMQCESTFADAFRERRSRGRVERTTDDSPEALGAALIKLHRR